jgi:putative chitinase
MQLTHEQLDKCIPNSTDANIIKFLPFFNKYFDMYQIDTKERVAAFLAQICHESGSLKYVEEIADGTNYEFREDLGNLEFMAVQVAHTNHSTTGKWYKGHGLIQITGYYNHKKCGEALGIDLVQHPKLLMQTEYAVQSAMWFWNTHNCNALADVGDFRGITRKINGGYNGLSERIAHWERIRKILNIL